MKARPPHLLPSLATGMPALCGWAISGEGTSFL